MRTKRIVAIIITLLIVIAVQSLFSRGKNDNNKGDRGNVKGNYKNNYQFQKQKREEKGDLIKEKIMDQNRDRLRTRQMLQDQINECSQIKARIRERLNNNEDGDQLQIRERVRNMLKNNTEVIDNLDEKKQKRVRNQIRIMEESGVKLNNELSKDDETGNGEKVRERFIVMEKELNKIERQYRIMEWVLQDNQ